MNNLNTKVRKIAALSAAALLPVIQLPASAAVLEEIIVTAQKRSQSQQDVPISVAAFSVESLSNANITSVLDLQKLTPALNMNTGVGAALPFIRGFGNLVEAVGNESSVAVYMDGVYLSRVSVSYLTFNNIERVEVLAGPQGTLFGRNASVRY